MEAGEVGFGLDQGEEGRDDGIILGELFEEHREFFIAPALLFVAREDFPERIDKELDLFPQLVAFFDFLFDSVDGFAETLFLLINTHSACYRTF